MDLQKIIEAFEELGYPKDFAKWKIINMVQDRDKLEELIKAFGQEGDYRSVERASSRYRILYGFRGAEELPGDPLKTDKGIIITRNTIVKENIDFQDFVDAINKRGFCLQFGCTTCGNMELRNCCRRLGRDALIQLMLNTEHEAMVAQYHNSIYMWTINLLFPGAYDEFLEKKHKQTQDSEAEETADDDIELPY